VKKIFNDSFENWIFDLDNTVYDINAGVFEKISSRITDFIITALSVTREEANIVRSNMYKKYGLTLTGLMREYGIAPDEYLDYIHDVTHPELKYDEQLKLNLKNLTGRKFIYTNASKNHSKNILSVMGIEAEFEKILDIKATQYLPKPDPKSYNIMLKAFGISGDQIGNSIFIEDTAKNLRPAKSLGIKTVWIENEFNLKDYRENSEFIDYKYSDLKSFLNDIDYRN
jgi:putative hydrolase of the HAD superfamily